MNELRRLWQLFQPYRTWMLVGTLAAILTLLANVTLMAAAGWFLTAMAAAGAAGVAMNYFTPAALIRGSAMIRTAGRYGERLVNHEATFRLIASLRVWFYQHLEPLAPARLQQYHSGDLLSRIRADIDALDNLYVRVLVPVAVANVSIVLFTIFLLFYHPLLALSGLTFLVLAGVGLPIWSQARGLAPGRRIAEDEAALRTAVIDGVQGLAELTLYGAAERQARHIDSLSRRLIADQTRLSSDHGLTQAAVGLCASLSLWVLLWIAIPLVDDGRLMPPQLAMLALFTLASFEAVAPLPQAFQMLGRTLAAAHRLFAIVDTEPAVAEPSPPSPRPERFDIEFADVRFSYPDAPRPAVSGIRLQVPQGTRAAVIGATGSGKSTLFNLLLRFWAPDSGSIRVGGHDILDFHGDDLRRHIAVVSQHTHLFDATIRENLLIANPDAPQAAIEAACRVAQIHDFIAELPEGYDTWVGETGVRLSGGQGRRIAVARALLKDAPILLLDEPTEGLDAATERDLMQALDTLMVGRTVLLITHRPAGLDWVDQVLVLDQGRELARGDVSVIPQAMQAALLPLRAEAETR
ncbi:thiol reductant ABC exporter subunit CydC [Allochromatium vinosum]|uniref:ABC transporter, CydDC cysteine exporter (CydDC-E) family, permease/ATP-binding protein CydC n=1 Tax=Allochromatium vinosum (strain ATCC 17899 / DSM 180 / NBRC 103801 / NCIMB 10441 / D) TaxID=572477 RepID=D3RNS9_ALLVD|nr:thiol reductant ABC exporter subunit CydC [Allochromatium vinosum]ADC61439.1 ABC transporter, CydDC cysteine exporter (CydDC-E) family, permease/ATP-binding protein CydC [Allochromatium vinosum DSM 180]